ncbi:MAG: MGMT family protein [Candidatus Shapirobacteria bacterium]|jgi:methylated-DNA-[protein]-cysteine S-methyltransferase
MSKFRDKVYKIVKKVPVGNVTTYKVIADIMGCKCYRAIGQALRNNPFAPEVPCHRVVKSNGKIGGYFGFKDGKYQKKKMELLKEEGVKICNGRVSDFKEILFRDL